MTKPEKVACRNPREICAQNRKSGLTKHTRHPDKELTHAMLSDLIAEVGPTEERPLVLHSDGGAVYMTGDWASECEEGNVVRSMSRKARSGDNARAEGFFGTLKCDFFRGKGLDGRGLRGVRRRARPLHRVVPWREAQEGARMEDDPAGPRGARGGGVAGIVRKNVRGPKQSARLKYMF